jgi:tetratricopeptide (TPR) repeat protein
MLMVLDNALDSEQVRPLLPGSPDCAVLVTSRRQLTGLVARYGAVRLAVPPLSPQEAASLLRMVVGTRRADAEPEAVDALVRLCGYLPLALRIAADLVVTRPHLRLATLAEELSEEHHRLDVLATDDPAMTVGSVFSWSYRALDAGDAQMFRLLGLHPGPEVCVSAAAAIAAVSIRSARQKMRALADRHLLQEIGHDRFRFHDLLQLYAAGQAGADEPPAAREAAIDRLLSWYLDTADAADRRLHLDRPRQDLPAIGRSGRWQVSFTGHDQALRWCETERINLISAVRLAAATGRHDIAWQLPAALFSFYELTRHVGDWITTHQTGLDAAQRLGNGAAQGWLLRRLGAAHWCVRADQKAIATYQQALTIYRANRDRQGEASTLNNLACLHAELGRHQFAAELLGQAGAVYQAAGDVYAEATILNNLGNTYRLMGRCHAAMDSHRKALARLYTVTGRQDLAVAVTLHSLGDTSRVMGDLGVAIGHFRAALEIHRGLGNHHGEAITLHSLGDTLKDIGELPDAERCLKHALTIQQRLGNEHASRAVRESLDRLQAVLAPARSQPGGQGDSQREAGGLPLSAG